MSSKNNFDIRKSLSVRIAVLYALLYVISSLVVFSGFYTIIISVLNNEINEDLLSDVRELELVLEASGYEQLVEDINDEAEADGFETSLFRVFSIEGELLESTRIEEWEGLKIDKAVIRDIARGVGEEEKYSIISFTLPEKEFEVRSIYAKIGSEFILQIGLVLEENGIFLSLLRNTFYLLILIIIIISFFISIIIAGRAMKGVEAVTRTAQEISEGGALDRRVAVDTKDTEILRLAQTFNNMLNHIQVLLTEIEEISDNIAHDLKTPITRIRGLAEVTLTSNNSTLQDYKGMTSDTIEECDNLLEILTSMLYISKADTGISTIQKKKIDLSDIINTACELFSPVADDKGIKIDKNIPESCFINADHQGIQRVVANLLDNAIKYTPPKGKIRVGLMDDGSKSVLSIADTGIGIAEKNLSLIFKRFYRCHDDSDVPGIGLGLSLVKAIVNQHSGSINLQSEQNEGTTIVIRLPKD